MQLFTYVVTYSSLRVKSSKIYVSFVFCDRFKQKHSDPIENHLSLYYATLSSGWWANRSQTLA